MTNDKIVAFLNKNKNLLIELINKLPERERIVMTLRYDQEKNLKQIGEFFEISPSRVSQIHSEAIKRLKNQIEFTLK